MSISTHVLDAVTGRPAADVGVELESVGPSGHTLLARRRTGVDGRVADLADDLTAGDYRLRFDTDAYFAGATFYPEVSITFTVSDPAAHNHVPLLLSPYAYSTYRGS